MIVACFCSAQNPAYNSTTLFLGTSYNGSLQKSFKLPITVRPCVSLPSADLLSASSDVILNELKSLVAQGIKCNYSECYGDPIITSCVLAR